MRQAIYVGETMQNKIYGLITLLTITLSLSIPLKGMELQQVQIASTKNMSDVADSCCICLEPLKARTCVQLPCKGKHLLHKVCVDSWIGQKSMCPLDSEQVKVEEIIPVNAEDVQATLNKIQKERDKIKEERMASSAVKLNECPICHEPIANNKMVVLPCTGREHVFCHECIVNYLAVKAECPVDRTPIDQEDVDSIKQLYPGVQNNAQELRQPQIESSRPRNQAELEHIIRSHNGKSRFLSPTTRSFLIACSMYPLLTIFRQFVPIPEIKFPLEYQLLWLACGAGLCAINKNLYPMWLGLNAGRFGTEITQFIYTSPRLCGSLAGGLVGLRFGYNKKKLAPLIVAAGMGLGYYATSCLLPNKAK